MRALRHVPRGSGRWERRWTPPTQKMPTTSPPSWWRRPSSAAAAPRRAPLHAPSAPARSRASSSPAFASASASDSASAGKVALLGVGHLGSAIARGLVSSGTVRARDLVLSDLAPLEGFVDELQGMEEEEEEEEDAVAVLPMMGPVVAASARDAVEESRLVILAVAPQHVPALLDEMAPALDPQKHVVVSVMGGVSTAEIRAKLGVALLGQTGGAASTPRSSDSGAAAADDDVAARIRIVRAMPNTAVAVLQSMTCISGEDAESVEEARRLFASVGDVMVINEEDMLAATALCGCGTAFFARAIRAAAQGGVEVGFHAEDAIRLAAQTALGAAALVGGDSNSHPEAVLDRVTTPKGCTIAGLNEMEHNGFSSAFIKGVVTSARKAAGTATGATNPGSQ